MTTPVTPLAGFAGTQWASFSNSDPPVIFHDTFGDILTGINAVDKTQHPCFACLMGFTNALDATSITATLGGNAMDVVYINGAQDISTGTGFTIVALMLCYDQTTNFTDGDMRVTINPGGSTFLNTTNVEPMIFTHVNPTANAGWGGVTNYAGFNDIGSGPAPGTVGPIAGVDGGAALAMWVTYGNGIGFPPTVTLPNDYTSNRTFSIMDTAFGEGAIGAYGPYSATSAGQHGFYAGSTGFVGQLLPLFDSVIPHNFSGTWAQDLSGETGGSSGHVITQTFANGSSVSPALYLSILGAFHGEVTGSVSASDVTATFGGLPCQVALVNESVNPGRFMCIVQCIPDAADTFAGSDFVLTFAPATGTLFYYHAWAGLSSNVDPSTTLADCVVSNSGAILNPYSQTIGAVASAAGDMLATSMLVDEVTQQPLPQSPAMTTTKLGIATQNWGASNRVCPTDESNAVTWGAAGLISQQAAYGFSTNIKLLLPQTTVPNIVGLPQADANAAILAALLTIGAVTALNSDTVPAGSVMFQGTPPGTIEPQGRPLSYTVSLGAAVYTVPYVIGLSNSDASDAIAAASLSFGTITTVHSLFVPVGVVIDQTPVAGTSVPAGSAVNVVESSGPPPPPPLIEPFDVRQTVISQYANSPTILALVDNIAEALDPRANLETFYNFVWNVDTAEGFGLDIWGRIVGVSRLLTITGDSNVFGFFTTDVPLDWQPFGQAPFSGGPLATHSFILGDDAYRTLILTKALANICATTAPALNRLLRNLFPGRGNCFVLDNGNMSMTFVFQFSLTVIEFAILTQSGALPHPAGVFYDVSVIVGSGSFGFKQQGVGVQPFNQGTFYKR